MRIMLLLKHPETGPRAEETEVEIPPDAARVFGVARGQLLTIRDLDGRRPVALFAFTNADLREFLSPHHTRVFNNTYVLALGMRLVTNRRRPMFVLGKDTVGRHDVLLPASTVAYLERKGLKDRPGCVETVRAALGNAGLEPPKIPDPVNLFTHVDVRADGRLGLGKPPSKPRDYVTFRVLIDASCVVSTCATGFSERESATPILIRVHNDL